MTVSPSLAAEPYVVIGPGSVECGKLAELKKGFDDVGQGDEFEMALVTYAQGFWSGANFQRRMGGDKHGMRALEIDRSAISGEILRRCSSDPQAPLFTQLWLMFNAFTAANPAE